jgi:hypothetical protein
MVIQCKKALLLDPEDKGTISLSISVVVYQSLQCNVTKDLNP